jgi:D-glucosaminate-6-phosphate ammonia-lyase
MGGDSRMLTATSIYEELGVTPVINARGHNTVLGGSTPAPRVKEAMERAERYYVDMQELLDKAGQIVAELLEAEAAYVTPGAAAALALGTAACITGEDVELMARLPDTVGLRNRVVIQKRHHYSYERATTIVGTTLIEVGDDAGTTAEQLAAALRPDVANVLYPAHLEGTPGTLSLAEVIEIAHSTGVPVLVDAAGQVYPLERFTGYTRLGADLVCFGAKYFGAPNSSGILCGRKDLVEAAGRQGFIAFETTTARRAFGRPMKLDRQEIIAVVVALREWMAMDHEGRLAELERRLRTIGRRLEGLPGVSLEYVRQEGSAPRVLRVAIDPAAASRNADAVVAGLRAGSPAIYVRAEPDAIQLNAATLWEGDEEVVAQRLHALLA